MAAKRQAILALVAQRHGITKAEICLALGLAWGTVFHHVEGLLKEGAIRAQASHRRVFLFGAQVPEQAMTGLRLTACGNAAAIFQVLKARPGIGIQAISRSLDLSRKVVRRHVLELVDARLVHGTSDYQPKFCLAELAHQASAPCKQCQRRQDRPGQSRRVPGRGT